MLIHDPYVVNGFYGLVGGLVGVIVRERGCIYLPRLKDHRLYLNSFSGIVLGIVSGILGDHTPLNAIVWGIGGATVVSGLVEAVDRKTADITGLLCEKEKEKEHEQQNPG